MRDFIKFIHDKFVQFQKRIKQIIFSVSNRHGKYVKKQVAPIYKEETFLQGVLGTIARLSKTLYNAVYDLLRPL